MQMPHIISLYSTGSSDIGQLTVVEGENLPFVVKRAYWTGQVPTNKIRGHHAHHDLEQLIVAVHGVLEMVVETPDRVRHTFLLDEPSKALYIPRLCWREIKFGPEAVLMCLASEEYAESDYIRSYYDFAKLVEKQKPGSDPTPH
jgi:dTDP-4-dehydrorhamnose 3,5-epimerase-like enzyme